MLTGVQPAPLVSPSTTESLRQLQVHLPSLKIFSFHGPGQTGGVACSLAPLTRQLCTKVQWIALSGFPAENGCPIAGFSFHRPELSDELIRQCSKPVFNYLWPLFHGMPERAAFDLSEWKNFRQLSVMLAHQSQKITSRSQPTLFWLHDFEMVLLPPMLGIEAGVILSHFWHIPWPEPQIMAASPVGAELTGSLLANRVLGFHTREYACNYLNTVKLLIPQAQINLETDSISFRGNTTRLVAMPLALDYQYWQRLSGSSAALAETLPALHRLKRPLILGVDRLDYCKGILEKLAGFEIFLSAHPSYLGRIHFVQLAQPGFNSREIEAYAQQVRAKVRELNDRFRLGDWEPVIFMEGNFEHAQLAAWYQAADLLAVTPVRDGLNLVAKEFVACRQDSQGVLVLSCQAGVAGELSGGALLVEPRNVGTIAEALQQGLSMSRESQHIRMQSMRQAVSGNRLHDWACKFLRHSIGMA